MESDYSKVDKKLLLLYIIEKMEIPISYSQISKFTLEGSYMDYFTLQQSLSEMAEQGYLDKMQDNNNTRYYLTSDGETMLEYFEKHIPNHVRNQVNKYAIENIKKIKRDYEITANYFYEHDDNDIIVKCGVYDEDTMLMEINVTVVSKEQARLMCSNWKNNASRLYGQILTELVTSGDKISDENPL